MIVERPGTTQPFTNGTARTARRRPPGWRRRGVLLMVLAVLLLAVVLLALSRSQTSAPVVSTAQPAAPLIAHGQIVPVRQAHVGTQGGGVVQRLEVALGDQVAAQTPLAWVQGPSGLELILAPFDGTVANVLVHAGDTLLPGATIAVVADLRVLQVETSDVDEFLVSKVSPGQSVKVSVDALDNLTLNGTVTNVALLPQTGTSGGPAYPVIISVRSLPSEVRAGMSVRVSFPAGAEQ